MGNSQSIFPVCRLDIHVRPAVSRSLYVLYSNGNHWLCLFVSVVCSPSPSPEIREGRVPSYEVKIEIC